jgi:hypothetical protein
MNRRVSVWKYVCLKNGGWRYCKPTLAKNGKIRSDLVIVKGEAEHHPEGNFYLHRYDSGREIWKRVGPNAQDAVDAADFDTAYLDTAYLDTKAKGVPVKPHYGERHESGRRRKGAGGLRAGRTTAILQRSESMRCTRFTKPTRMIVGLLTGLLFATMAVPLGAQPASESRPGLGFGPVYDAAHEITVNGTIQKIVTRHVVGSPAGMHLLVARPEGVVDAHVGPFLSKETKKALQTGTPVRIVGATSSLNGKDYFLVRELTVGGSTVTVRSEHGLLVRVHSPRAQRARTEKTAQVELNGDAR